MITDRFSLSLLFVIATLITLYTAGVIYLGLLVTLPVALAGGVALLAWWWRAFRQPVDPALALPLYILTVVALIGQATEAYVLGYPAALTSAFPAAFPAPVRFDDFAFLAVFPLAATTLFLLGAVGLWYRHPLGSYSAWWLFLWAIVSGLMPFVIPLALAQGYGYFAGMSVGWLCAALGLIGVYRLWRAQPASHPVLGAQLDGVQV